MLAFAGNSILCRMALADGAIDPASFTSVRLAAGAAMLVLVSLITRRQTGIRMHGTAWSAAMLFLYAIAFSYAYVTLSTGTGALILFGFVQATMIAWGLWMGDRPGTRSWIGWAVAVAGLIWLLSPGVERPSASGAILMALAGIAWGVYSLRGRNTADALLSTSANFVLSLVFVLVLVTTTISGANMTVPGITIAVVSGAITSGLGYVIWYAALEYLSPMSAALVQLSVPAIAASGGVLLLDEPVSVRLVAATVLVLGGISIAITRKTG